MADFCLSCSQPHFFKISIQLLRGRKEDCKTTNFSCIVDVSFPLYVILNKKGSNIHVQNKPESYSGLWIGQLTKIEIGENQVWPIKNILN